VEEFNKTVAFVLNGVHSTLLTIFEPAYASVVDARLKFQSAKIPPSFRFSANLILYLISEPTRALDEGLSLASVAFAPVVATIVAFTSQIPFSLETKKP